MRDDIDRIHDALQYIPLNGHDQRVRVAFMLKSALGEAGRELWDEWRGDSGKDEADAVWRSASQSGELTIATLFYEAKANGWHDDGRYTKPTPEELADLKRIAAERAAKEEAAIARERADAAAKAATVMRSASAAKPDHPYLVQKGVSPVATLREIGAQEIAAILGYPPKSAGVELTGRLLVVPVKRDGHLATLELIDGDKRKAALAGRGTKAGGYWATERLPDGDGTGLTVLIGEGVATVLSAREATGAPAIASLSCGNLPAVATAARKRYPKANIVILSDLVKNSRQLNPHSVEAALACNGLLAIPEFKDTDDADNTDFNDLAAVAGLEAVGRAITLARAPGTRIPTRAGENAPAAVSGGWAAPVPLTVKVAAQPYPLDALPDVIRAAVEEVAGFVKAPLALVASSALASLSLACQAHIDAKRAEKLQGPTGLYLLTIADSGERKSTCDAIFTSAIRQYQDEQSEALKAVMSEYRAALAAWEAERDGLLSAVKQAGAKRQSTETLRTDLEQLQREKPESPRVPRLLLGDETPENLAWSLAKQWPSAAVLSSEAGVVFGSHGMGKDSVMRNLSLLNVLWDGGTHSIGRRTSESFTVRGARLTVALQIQEATLRAFYEKSGTLARGSGFLARFLIAWPESTQGTRFFAEAPANWPRLAAFHERISSILNQSIPIDEEGVLSPAVLSMAPDAKAAWVRFHDHIESLLITGGDLHDVRDVASKTADNAVRLAAIFQLFEHAVCGSIGLDSFERASRIAAWHLSESRRFFGELALPAELLHAARLDAWLIQHCERERQGFVSTRDAQRLGPVRDKEDLDRALQALAELERVIVEPEGRRKLIKLNPALLEAAP